MLSYQIAGDGPTVVLLHGFPFDRTTWKSQVNALSQRFRMVAPDLPGLGASPPLTGAPNIAAMADAVVALLDDLHAQKAAVIGHSMGGYVALALALSVPERLAALGLVSTQARADTPEGRAGRTALAEQVAANGAGKVWDAMGAKLFDPTLPVDSPLRTSAQALIESAPPAGVRAALQAMAHRPDLLPQLPTIRVPALTLAGAGDQLIPPARTDEMAAAIPGAKRLLLAGAGHMPMWEQPAALTAALADWLGDLPRW